MKNYLIILLSYMLGSIPFGVIIAGLKNIDIKKQGSGNIGATNVSRVLGKKLGMLTLLLDSAKGIIPLIIAQKLNVNFEIVIN
ncbi:MAG: hypothetical protein EOP45_19615 [Sphingobacteriaceae bacterium]|nr:MAG: hypothetical protein EOP45_19615 [Sphingobacteriaceae bacterium]